MNDCTHTVGIIKEIDSLGRIVIPKEIRERLALRGRVELVLTENGALIRSTEYELVKKQIKTIKSRLKRWLFCLISIYRMRVFPQNKERRYFRGNVVFVSSTVFVCI